MGSLEPTYQCVLNIFLAAQTFGSEQNGTAFQNDCIKQNDLKVQ